jgi:branched-chain amino acid transport system substrate-binding protein
MKRPLILLVGVALLAMLLAACGGGSSSSSSSETTGSESGSTEASSETAGGESSSGGEEGSGAEGKLKIGFSAALAGSFAPFDAPELAGMEFAEKKINGEGGLDGIEVEVISENNKGETSATATTTQDLLDKEITSFVMTTADSSVAGGQLIQNAGGVMTMGVNTPPVLLEEIGDHAFNINFTDNLQAAADAEYACEQGYKSAYELVAPQSPYTSEETMGKYFAEAFEHDCGGKVTGSDQFTIGSTNFGSQVTKLQNASPAPELIFTSMFVPDSGTFLKQLRGAGVETPFIGTDGDDDPAFAETAGSAANGAVYSTHQFPEPGGTLEKFDAEFEKVMGKPVETSTFEAIGRDQVYALVEAAHLAGSFEPEPMAEALASLKNYETIQGNLTMLPGRYPELPAYLVEIDNGKPKLVAKIAPKFIPEP